MTEDSGFLRHAKRELDAIGMKEEDPDTMNGAMRKHILHMVGEFAKEGHSGFSAEYARDILNKLFGYEPLCPLTGEDSEWNDVRQYGSNPVWQNNRCSRVFKDSDGIAYDIDGKIFVEPNGCSYTNIASRVDVTFPYTPKSEYIEVPFQEETA
jgi:hypothetical protein